MLYFFRLSEDINYLFELLIFFGVSSNKASFKFSSITFLNKCCSYSSRLNASFFIVCTLHLTKNNLCRFRITWCPKYANSTGCSIVYNVVSHHEALNRWYLKLVQVKDLSAEVIYFLWVGKVEKNITSGQQPRYNTSFAKM